MISVRAPCFAAPVERLSRHGSLVRIAGVLVARNVLKRFFLLFFLLGYFLKLGMLPTDTPYSLLWPLRCFRYFFLPRLALRLSWRQLRGEACALRLSERGLVLISCLRALLQSLLGFLPCCLRSSCLLLPAACPTPVSAGLVRRSHLFVGALSALWLVLFTPGTGTNRAGTSP